MSRRPDLPLRLIEGEPTGVSATLLERRPRIHLAVRCPKCGAEPGEHCASRKGIKTPSAPHLARVRLVRGGKPKRFKY